MSHIQRQGLELSIFNQSQSSPILEDRRGIADGSPTRNELTFEAAAPNLIGQKSRLVIIVFIVSSNIVQMISNMVGLAAGLEFSKALGAVVGPGQANWTAASYPLTQGTFVLISGRLGTVYGHRNVLVAGAVWLVIWSLGNGFCTNYAAFNIARAFSGIGGAFIMPNAMALISTTIPPGKMRNITLGFFSASAPIGSYLGALWAGLFIHYVNWKWIFFSM
ncbi:MFS general substrate transporter [Lipomyces tetrasporus]|uniref:MFS general substrate transporter n=1 Tax=Lipomyces tetrasporus TaxID=54092 RepID=A0AAD7QXL7_9ASCO|nr:MFS general substrate transporter [Lipomyces tetrasporus]KAJ8103370.1 MFS general substrate transporter [Lipomyces tetrasporus]